MIKKIIAITTIALTLVTGTLLSSCEKTIDVIEKYNEATEFQSYFSLNTLPTDPTSKGTLGDIDYYQKVIDGRFKTFADLTNYAYRLFSKEIADDLLNSNLYVDINGELYALDASRGSDIYKGAETYTVENVSDKKINFFVEVEIFGEDLSTVVRKEKYEFVYEKIDDQWVFTKFPTIR